MSVSALPSCVVRPALHDDATAIAELCAQHARYENAAAVAADLASRLHAELSANPPRLHAWIATSAEEPIGYATATAEFSTWAAREYLHMDCLFVRADARGHGIGAQLLQRVIEFALEQGYAELQWQTPAWNADAIRFYTRFAAAAKAKQRFVLRLS